MPDPRDLCTLADVRGLMQKKGSDTTQDTLIATLITRVSVKIMTDYGREFVPGGPESLTFTAATRTFEYPWGEQYPDGALVDLAPYDLRATVTPTVQVDTDQAQPLTLTSDEFRLWPQPVKHGVFKAVKVQPIGATVGLVGWSKRQIQVTGTWGFPSIPVDVTQAAASLVIHWLSANPALQRPGDLDAGAASTNPRGYSLECLDLLRSFERMTH